MRKGASSELVNCHSFAIISLSSVREHATAPAPPIDDAVGIDSTQLSATRFPARRGRRSAAIVSEEYLDLC